MFFDARCMKKSVNDGESRISLQILEEVGFMKGLSRLMDTSIHTGVIGDKEDINRRHRIFGKHSITTPQIESFWWVKLPRQFED